MSTTTHNAEQSTAIAKQARRQGYEAPSRFDAFVYCPQCRSEVYADAQAIGGRSGDSATVFPALDTAMLAHLPHCL